MNIDPGSHRGWKTSFHEKLVIFRVYVYLLEGTPPETSETSPQVAKINVCKARASHFVCHFAMVPFHVCPWWVQLGEILLITFGSNLMLSDVSGYQALPRKPATAEP